MQHAGVWGLRWLRELCTLWTPSRHRSAAERLGDRSRAGASVLLALALALASAVLKASGGFEERYRGKETQGQF